MLFHNRMQAGARDPYVLSNILSFGTKGKRDRFVAALQAIVDRHDVLRTSFHWEGLPAPLPRSYSEKQPSSNLPAHRPYTGGDLEGGPAEKRVRGRQHIDTGLGRAPLMNIHKVEGPSSDKCHIVLSWHHMVMDHVGMEQITREVISFYKGSFTDLPSPVPYREFVGRLQHIRANTDYLSHFRDRFSHVDTPTLAYGVTDVNIDGKNVQERKRAISIEQSRRIRRCCKAHNISPAALFHAAWGLIVGRTSGENSVVFGTVLFGRTESADSLQSLGLYINTLPIALRLEGTVKDYLERVYEELSILVNYEQVNLAEIKGLTRLKDGNVPLFNTLINYRYSLMDAESEDDALFERMGISVVGSQERTNYPLSLSVDDFGETFALSVQIADELKVGTETILDYTQRAIGELTDVLETGSSVSVGEVGILPNREIELLDSWNRTEVEYPAETCIHQLFENQAEKRPDATALVFQDESMSYRQLNERANQLAHCLREERKVGPDTLVGICLDRSLEMIVSILAILKAGGAYLPLDPDYPVSRLEYMAKDAGLRTVVTTKRLKEKLDGVLGKDATIDIESEDGKLSGYPKTNIPAEVSGLTSSNLAYVIYTSGSTGRPKGVMVEHRSVTALVKNVDYVQLDSNSVLLQNATISFDAATFEIWGALLNGGRTVINPNRVTDISGLEQIIEKNDVNTVFLTTALFNQFATETVDERLRSIKQLYTGGELHNSQIIESYLGQHENTSLYNIYGVTECTTFSSVKLLSKEEVSQGSQLPIGKPISNTSLYVLDVNRQRVPVGVAGELYIGGAGVARGYLNRPELTAERFVENTFGDDPNDRLYRTGDLVKYLPDGNLVFLGRMDHQVKLRGFRIELGEIENVLSGNGTVQNAVATLHNNEHLVAYVAVGDTDKLAENFNAELPGVRQGAPAGIHGAILHRTARQTAAKRQREGRPEGVAGPGRVQDAAGVRRSVDRNGDRAGWDMGKTARRGKGRAERQLLPSRRAFPLGDPAHREATGQGMAGDRTPGVLRSDARRAGEARTTLQGGLRRPRKSDNGENRGDHARHAPVGGTDKRTPARKAHRQNTRGRTQYTGRLSLGPPTGGDALPQPYAGRGKGPVRALQHTVLWHKRETGQVRRGPSGNRRQARCAEDLIPLGRSARTPPGRTAKSNPPGNLPAHRPYTGGDLGGGPAEKRVRGRQHIDGPGQGSSDEHS